MIKSQSAMEYLMTYGWAILIIAVVLAALFELGVFNPMTFAPKASPGSCQVVRPDGPGTTDFISLSGECNGELPQYVAQFRSGSKLENITINDLPSIAPSAGDSFTIAIWVDPIHTSSFYGVAEAGPGTQIGWSTEFSPNGIGWLLSNTLAPGGTWTFITAEETVGTSASIYLNGAITAYTTENTSIQSAGSYRIGSYFVCCQYEGAISNVQIYNTALSPNGIKALYQEGIGGAPIKIQSLVAWYPLNGNSDDYSGNNNNGVPNGVTYTSNWYSGYSAP